MRQSYKLIFERSREGRRAYDLPALDVPAANCAIPENMRAESKKKSPDCLTTCILCSMQICARVLCA